MSVYIRDILTGGATTVVAAGGVVTVDGSRSNYQVLHEPPNVRLDVVPSEVLYFRATIGFDGTSANANFVDGDYYGEEEGITYAQYEASPYDAWSVYADLQYPIGTTFRHEWVKVSGTPTVTLVSIDISTGNATMGGMLLYLSPVVPSGSPSVLTKYRLTVYVVY